MLAKICVKTRDRFACAIHVTDCDHIKCDGCAIAMEPLSYNCQWCHIKSARRYHSRWLLFNALCGCAHCHRWAHDNPVQFGKWFAKKYPDRDALLSEPRETITWREVEFKATEYGLLIAAKELKVDPLHFPEQYRKRFQARIKESK